MSDLNRRYKPGEIGVSPEFTESESQIGRNPYISDPEAGFLLRRNKQVTKAKTYKRFNNYHGDFLLRAGTTLLVGGMAVGATLVLYESVNAEPRQSQANLAATCSGTQTMDIEPKETAKDIVADAQARIHEQTGVLPAPQQLQAAIYDLNDKDIWLSGVEFTFYTRADITYVTIPTTCEPLTD